MSGLAALADGGEWRDWGWRFVCRRYRSVPAPVRSRRSGWACPLKGVMGSAVWRWLGVGGHFEEVEDAADISVQSSQGLGDMKPTHPGASSAHRLRRRRGRLQDAGHSTTEALRNAMAPWWWTGRLDAPCPDAKFTLRPSVDLAVQYLSSKRQGPGQRGGVSSSTCRVTNQYESYTRLVGSAVFLRLELQYRTRGPCDWLVASRPVIDEIADAKQAVPAQLAVERCERVFHGAEAPVDVPDHKVSSEGILCDFDDGVASFMSSRVCDNAFGLSSGPNADSVNRDAGGAAEPDADGMGSVLLPRTGHAGVSSRGCPRAPSVASMVAEEAQVRGTCPRGR